MKENSPVHQLGNFVDRPWGVSEIGGSAAGVCQLVAISVDCGRSGAERFGTTQKPVVTSPGDDARRGVEDKLLVGEVQRRCPGGVNRSKAVGWKPKAKLDSSGT